MTRAPAEDPRREQPKAVSTGTRREPKLMAKSALAGARQHVDDGRNGGGRARANACGRLPAHLWFLHDIGYVRGVVKGDSNNSFVVNEEGMKVALSRGASDAALGPYPV